jgi:hypothetical protein
MCAIAVVLGVKKAGWEQNIPGRVGAAQPFWSFARRAGGE